MLVENDPFVGGEMSKMLPERHRTFDENFFDNLELSSGKRVDKAPGTGSDSTQSRVGPSTSKEVGALKEETKRKKKRTQKAEPTEQSADAI